MVQEKNFFLLCNLHKKNTSPNCTCIINIFKHFDRVQGTKVLQPVFNLGEITLFYRRPVLNVYEFTRLNLFSGHYFRKNVKIPELKSSVIFSHQEPKKQFQQILGTSEANALLFCFQVRYYRPMTKKLNTNEYVLLMMVMIMCQY